MDLLGQTLETFYRQHDSKVRIDHDPVAFPHRYRSPVDIETAAFVATCLAYGRVGLFWPVLERMFRIMDPSPYTFVLEFDVRRDGPLFSGISYRMNRTSDIVAFLLLLSRMIRDHGSIGGFFKKAFRKSDLNILRALSRFVKVFYAGNTEAVYGDRTYPFGLCQMLPFPDKGGACKRANLFLRWMVRKDDGVDFGLWGFIPTDRLVMPLDTHVARIARHLGLTERKTTDIKTALEITDRLKRYDPIDPVKYDFALCHLGISGRCPRQRSRISCLSCTLRDVCVR